MTKITVHLSISSVILSLFVFWQHRAQRGLLLLGMGIVSSFNIQVLAKRYEQVLKYLQIVYLFFYSKT